MKPNFFIVGAPRSGTTAIYEYLKHHPEVFMSGVKEPFFFHPEWPDSMKTTDLDAYLRLFDKCPGSVKVSGEASAGYLSSPEAIRRIHEFNAGSKILVMLRNPVEAVYSLYNLNVLGNREIDDFQEAWSLQESRFDGADIPEGCPNPLSLQYATFFKLGTQVKDLLEVFPRNQVKLVLYDDFSDKPLDVYKDILGFLEVDYDGRMEFPKVHQNSALRFPLISRFMMNPPAWLKKIRTAIKETAGREFRKFSYSMFLTEAKRPELSGDFQKELRDYFREEVDLLSKAWDADLSSWK